MSSTRQPKVLPVTVGISKLSQIAVFPRKINESSPVYSLAIVQREDNRAEDTAYRVEKFMTNLSFNIPEDHYIEITANSLLHDQGYFLAQGTIVLGPGENDELVIPLYKYAEMADLELPSEVLQFIVKKSIPYHCSLAKGSSTPSAAREAPGFNTNNSFYQPPPKTRQDSSVSRNPSAFMPDFGDSSPSHPTSSSSSRSRGKSTHLF